jgi:ribosomal protein L22
MPGGAFSYELYRWIDLSKKTDQELKEIKLSKRKIVSLNEEIKNKELHVQKVFLQNKKILEELKALEKYKDTTSVNSRITGLFIKHRVKLLSFKTSREKKKGAIGFILVELSGEGSENSVVKLLSSLSNNIPMELQSLGLLLHTRNLLMNLSFKVPVIVPGRQ